MNEFSEQLLYEKYITENLTLEECKDFFKCRNIRKWLKFYGIKKDVSLWLKNTKKKKKEVYGSETYNNRPKMKLTKKERYGDEKYNNREKLKETLSEKSHMKNQKEKPFLVEILDKRGMIKPKYKRNNCELILQKFPKESSVIFEESSWCVEESFRNRLYIWKLKFKAYPSCPVCNQKITKFDGLTNGFHKYCSKACSILGQKINFRKTCQRLYGVDNINQLNEIKNKKQQHFIETYNVCNPAKIPEVANKISKSLKELSIERKNDIVEQRKKTLKNNTGFEHALQNESSYMKAMNTGSRWKTYIWPSGKTCKVQGYEHLALDVLLTNRKYLENDIIVKTKDITELIGVITYKFDGTQRRYFPDFYIKSKNLIIEVKSKWTFNIEKEKNLAKQKACLAKNINFEFMIFE